MKVKFTATETMEVYNGNGFTMRDGDVRDLPDAEATRLVDVRGDNFTFVTEKASKPAKTRGYRPSKDK